MRTLLVIVATVILLPVPAWAQRAYVGFTFGNDYGSIGDEINDVARAGVRVLWRF